MAAPVRSIHPHHWGGGKKATKPALSAAVESAVSHQAHPLVPSAQAALSALSKRLPVMPTITDTSPVEQQQEEVKEIKRPLTREEKLAALLSKTKATKPKKAKAKKVVPAKALKPKVQETPKAKDPKHVFPPKPKAVALPAKEKVVEVISAAKKAHLLDKQPEIDSVLSFIRDANYPGLSQYLVKFFTDAVSSEYCELAAQEWLSEHSQELRLTCFELEPTNYSADNDPVVDTKFPARNEIQIRKDVSRMVPTWYHDRHGSLVMGRKKPKWYNMTTTVAYEKWLQHNCPILRKGGKVMATDIRRGSLYCEKKTVMDVEPVMVGNLQVARQFKFYTDEVPNRIAESIVIDHVLDRVGSLYATHGESYYPSVADAKIIGTHHDNVIPLDIRAKRQAEAQKERELSLLADLADCENFLPWEGEAEVVKPDEEVATFDDPSVATPELASSKTSAPEEAKHQEVSHVEEVTEFFHLVQRQRFINAFFYEGMKWREFFSGIGAELRSLRNYRIRNTFEMSMALADDVEEVVTPPVAERTPVQKVTIEQLRNEFRENNSLWERGEIIEAARVAGMSLDQYLWANRPPSEYEVIQAFNQKYAIIAQNNLISQNEDERRRLDQWFKMKREVEDEADYMVNDPIRYAEHWDRLEEAQQLADEERLNLWYRERHREVSGHDAEANDGYRYNQHWDNIQGFYTPEEMRAIEVRSASRCRYIPFLLTGGEVLPTKQEIVMLKTQAIETKASHKITGSADTPASVNLIGSDSSIETQAEVAANRILTDHGTSSVDTKIMGYMDAINSNTRTPNWAALRGLVDNFQPTGGGILLPT